MFPAVVDCVQGSFLAGAVGDALGAPVEFLKRSQMDGLISAPAQPRFIAPAYGRLGAITDDTQMTLFTAEGLMSGFIRGQLRGIASLPGCLTYAYLRWMATQSSQPAPISSWLLEAHPELHQRRAPGNTCLSSLTEPLHYPARNNSKGCGAVMRSAPFGLFIVTPDSAGEAAAITHGHPEAQISSILLARIISRLKRFPIERAITDALCPDRLDYRQEHVDQESLSVLLTRKALRLAEQRIDPEVAIPQLGEGWVAEEALAIAVFCALRCDGDLWDGLRMAVLHDGDSDSTGSIAGNILGAQLGLSAIPGTLLEQLELRELITEVATDFATISNVHWHSEEPEHKERQDYFWARYKA